MVYIYFFKKVVFCINFHGISGVDWFFFLSYLFEHTECERKVKLKFNDELHCKWVSNK